MLGLQRERQARNWTQQFVGEKCGVTKQAISEIERGQKTFSYKLLVKLEDLFGMSHRELMKNSSDYNTDAE